MPVSKADAARLVDRHVEPKACFVTTDNGRDYRPIIGTGCAHWVSHQLGIRRGTPGGSACDLGYAIRVPDVLTGRASVLPADVQAGDVWANDGRTHTGLVDSVTQAEKEGQKPKVVIRHCSSGQGGVATNDWATYFRGGGHFYR